MILRSVEPRLRRAARAEAVAAYRRLPIDQDVVLYESFAGNGMLCNPEAIYRALRADPRFARLRHVWVLDDPTRHPAVVAELAADDRVSVVTRRSARYFRALSTAGYLVNNATFPAEFGKRPGQVYLNTWHGTPIKRMGYDIPGGAPDARNVVRNLLQADFLVSASPFMTEQLYATGYKMRGIHPGLVIEEGYPRVDQQRIDGAEARATLGVGSPADDVRIVLYAPTWRGGSFQDPRDDSAELAERVRTLQDRLGPGWRVLVKVHQAVFGAAQRSADLGPALVANDLPTNQVLAAADVLVADYSSIIVDYLPLDRPIVLFTPDRSEYDELRGRYQPAPGWPGPARSDLDDVAATIRAIGTGGPDDPERSHREHRRTWRDQLCPHEDGGASQRVVDVVFGGARDGHRMIDLGRDGRRRLLIYVGELKPNGMTASAQNLLRAIDHDRIDVTAIYSHTGDEEQAAAVAAMEPRVRALARFGAINGSKASQAARHLLQQRGVPAGRSKPPLAGLFRAEWERCLGQATFDSVVDFIGYGAFMDLMLLQGGAPQGVARQGGAPHRAIWMHNDMVADSRRDVGGRQPLRRRLEAVFTLYRFFDRLVSVSPALREVNRGRLGQYASADRFTHAVNVIDAEGVLARASAEVEWQPPFVPDGTTTFVASGRLSHAKNFPRMVSAFAEVHAEQPLTRLVILGDGPDRALLEKHIAGLGVGDGVLLAGHQPNPFPLMAGADCFVMSSDHEGQPMVILEALVLGLPVVTTRFDSVASALPGGQGLVVPRSVAGVADGMRAFLRGEVPRPTFDAQAYNADAVAQFLAAVGLG